MFVVIVVIIMWKRIHSRYGAEGLSFYYPRLLFWSDQVLAMMLLSHHPVFSSKTVRAHIPCGARCMRHAIKMWSVVFSEALHLKFGEEVCEPHLCMDKWNHPTPVLRRLGLTQAAWDNPIPTGLVLILGTKPQSLEVFSQYSTFHL